MGTIEATRNKWPFIFEELGFPPYTGGTHYRGPCPICGKENHFRFDDRNKDGDWICTCGNGKGIELIQEVFQLDFADACIIADKIVGNTKEQSNHNFKSKEELAELDFQKYLKPSDSQIKKYFKNRGIHILPNNDSLRYSPKHMYDHTTHVEFPCMIGKVVSHAGTYSYIHKTFLFNGNKINLHPQRKLYTLGTGPKGASIQLFKYEKVLGLAEGIETAMSTTQVYDVPTWSTVNTVLMKKFVCPKGVETLVIFADNDRNLSGQSAAYECARRNMLTKNDLKTIIIMWPEKVGNDFNDSLINKTFSTITQKFEK